MRPGLPPTRHPNRNRHPARHRSDSWAQFVQAICHQHSHEPPRWLRRLAAETTLLKTEQAEPGRLCLEVGHFSNLRSCLPSGMEFVAPKTLRNDANSEVAERQSDGSQGLQPLEHVRLQVRRGATLEPVHPWFVDDTFATRSSVAPQRQMKNDPKPWAEAHGYHP